MELEEAIVALLAADPEITGEVEGRIAAAVLPESLSRPNIVYQRLDTGRQWHNDGPAGMPTAAVQISCYADDYPTAKALATAVKDLDGYSGTVGDPVTGLYVGSMFLDDERDAPTPPAPGEAAGISGVILVFRVSYRE